MYFCGLFNLDDWDDEAKYIVFDDVDIKFFPLWKFFFGCQKRGTVVDKYRKKRTVTNGRPCIWLCNEDIDPFGSLSRAAGEWLSVNAIVFRYDYPLFISP